MAAFRCCAGGLVAVAAWAAAARAVGPVAVREVGRPGEAARVLIEMKAEGLYTPAAPVRVGGAGAASEPLDLKVETRFAFEERLLKADADGTPRRAVRRAIQAASAINGEIRPMAAVLRPDVSLLVAERRDGGVVAFSPGGPLTRSELELVEGPGDPLILPALLPTGPVAVGDRWTVADVAARALSGYDALASNRLQATLEALDDDAARIGLKGEIRGAALGGEGRMTCDGTATFDRRAGRVVRLELARDEDRQAGPVEAALDVKSTLIVTRTPIETPAELTAEALADVPLDRQEGLELLRFEAPGGTFTLLHDRDWHIYWDDPRLTVLKRLDHGELVAQCNLAAGPPAGRGRHQDLRQFREDVRRALGKRFVRFASEGEVDGAPAGGFRYRIVAQGREGQVGVIWIYYLVASPEGDQILATFTLGESQARQFGDGDLRLIGSLEWSGAAASPRP